MHDGMQSALNDYLDSKIKLFHLKYIMLFSNLIFIMNIFQLKKICSMWSIEWECTSECTFELKLFRN